MFEMHILLGVVYCIGVIKHLHFQITATEEMAERVKKKHNHRKGECGLLLESVGFTFLYLVIL